MTNIELQRYLKRYPDNLPIKILPNHISKEILDFDEEYTLHTSETAYVNENAPENDWDCEDGKIELGNGQRYLLINPIIIY